MFATVACAAWENFAHMCAAMAHAEYAIRQRDVPMAPERDLGTLREWVDLIVRNTSVDVG
jgi:hypothetical protein